MKKYFIPFLYIFISFFCFSQEKFDLGFITNPKNGRVKGLNEVSLDRTYLNSKKQQYLLTEPKKLVIISVKSYKCVNIVVDEIGGKV